MKNLSMILKVAASKLPILGLAGIVLSASACSPPKLLNDSKLWPSITAILATPDFTYTSDPLVNTVGVAVAGNAPSVSAQTGMVWSVVSPALPSGLSIDPATGVISGTPDTVTADQTYTVALDWNGSRKTGHVEIAINDIAPSFLTYATHPEVLTVNLASNPNTPSLPLSGPLNSWGAATLYSVAPALPPGLVIDSHTGIISGTPAAITAATNYTITAANTGGSTTYILSISVNDRAPVFTYTTSPETTQRTVASTPNDPVIDTWTPVHTSGGGAPTGFSISPALPTGLSINTTTGRISGTPTVNSSATDYTVTATNSGGSATRTLNITVNDAPPAFTYTTNPATYTKSSAISANNPISTGGAITLYSVNPALPTGLTLNTSTGVISGTPSVVSPTANYTVTGTNAGGSANVTLSLTVNDTPPAFTYTTNPATYTKGTAISTNAPINTGGTVSSYSISPSLPAGLSFNTSDGKITGTPTAVTAAANYTVTATNSGGSANVAVNITINDIPPVFSYSSNPAVYTKGTAITTNSPVNTGGAVVSYGVSPTLPAGLSLNTTTGLITGTPTAVTSAAGYTVTATNSGGSATVTVNITVNDIPGNFYYPTNPGIYTLSSAISNNDPVNTGGSLTSYAISPALPSGLAFSPSTGRISGTPSALSASTTYTINGSGTGGPASTTVTITVNDAAPAFSYLTNPATYTVGSAITTNTISSTGGTIVSFSVNPALPTGLSLNTSTGAITGTPSSVSAQTTYTVTGTNTGGTASVPVQITVNDVAPALTYSTNPATYTKGSAIASNNPVNTGGTILSYSVSPALPTGLSLNTTTGIVTGTPTAVTANATYTVTATNSGGSTTVGLQITVNDIVPAFSYSTNPATYVKGTAITANTVTSTGGAITGFSVFGTALPAGLSLNTSTGTITGTPTAVAATATYTIRATDSGGTTDVSLQITVNDIAPVFSYSVSNPVYTKSAVISPTDNPVNTGGTVISYSISPALPTGISLSTSTGIISGTPSVVSAANTYTITATNTGGSATATVNLTVNDILPALTYTTNPATYTRGTTITNNDPVNTGGSVISYSISPALTAGLSFDLTTGRISGTPTIIAGLVGYTVTATNSGGSTPVTVNITVNDIPPSSLSYSAPTPIYTKGIAITSNTPSVSGGPVVSYSVSPTLPAGLSLSTSTGVITGTPTAVVTAASYTVTATNSGGSTTASVNITVIDQAPTSLTYSTNPATYNKNNAITTNTPSNSGGTVVSYGVSPSLPAGLTLNTSTGLITGTPTALSGTSSYTITATNTGGSTTVSLSITVLENPPANLNYSQTSPSYPINVAIINNIPSATGGPIASYSISPTLPAGLSFNTSTGVISGTPTNSIAPTSFTVTATNSGGSATKVLTIQVSALAPALSSIFPTGGSADGGTPVTITGNYFQSGATVTVGGVSCAPVTVVSGTQITCTTSIHAAGLASVVVANADTQSGTLTNAFLFSAKVWLGGAAQSANAWSSNGLPATGSGDGMLASTLSNYAGPDGYLYVVDVNGNRIAKYDMVTGAFIGWIGAVNLSPTGGAAGCDTTPAGSATPGWCTGGSSRDSVFVAANIADPTMNNSGDGMLNNPNDVYVRQEGAIYALYVADGQNARIQKFNAGTGAFIGWLGKVGTAATGGGNCATPGSFSAAWCTGGTSTIGTGDGQLAWARSLRVDEANGTLYVADRDNNRVQKFNITTGAFLGWMGRIGTSAPSLPTSCTGGTPALSSPTPGWCTGGAGDTTTASNLMANFPGDGSLYSPRGIAIDSTATYMYVMETNNYRVSKFNVSTGAFIGWIGRIGTVGGTCTAGVGAYTGGWCTGGTSAASNNPNPALVSPVAANGGDGMIADSSRGVWIDNASGNLFIGDFSNNRIQRFTASTGTFTGWIGVVLTVPTGGDAGCTSATVGTFTPGWCTGGTSQSGTGAGHISGAAVVTFDPSRVYMYLSDNNNARINRYLVSTGQPAGSLGAVRNTAPAWIANGVPITGTGDGVMSNPFMPVSDGTYLYVSDTNNHRIMKYNLTSGSFVGWIGNINGSPTGGDAGCSGAAGGTFTLGWCTGGTAQSGTGAGMMNAPMGITLKSGVLYVADSANNRINKYTASSGAFLGWVGQLNGTAACGQLANAFNGGWCTTGTPKTGTTATSTTDGRMTTPRAVAVDATYMYVTDSGNSRILRFTLSSGAYSAWLGRIATTGGTCTAGVGSFTTGGFCTGGTSQVGTTAGDGTMTTPYGIAVSSGGDIVVADKGTHRVNWYNASGVFQGWIGRILATGGTCTAGAHLFTGAFCTGGTTEIGTTSIDGTLNAPQGVTFDTTGGYLYISDTGSNRVSKYKFSSGMYGNFVGWQGGIASSPTGGDPGCSGAQAGTATPGWCTGGASVSGNGNGVVSAPAGLSVGTSGDNSLYIGDFSNYRIIKTGL